MCRPDVRLRLERIFAGFGRHENAITVKIDILIKKYIEKKKEKINKFQIEDWHKLPYCAEC